MSNKDYLLKWFRKAWCPSLFTRTHEIKINSIWHSEFPSIFRCVYWRQQNLFYTLIKSRLQSWLNLKQVTVKRIAFIGEARFLNIFIENIIEFILPTNKLLECIDHKWHSYFDSENFILGYDCKRGYFIFVVMCKNMSNFYMLLNVSCLRNCVLCLIFKLNYL